MSTNVWAIRVGDHVEVRVGDKPKKLVSKWTKVDEDQTKMVYTNTYPHYKMVPLKIELKQISFIGAKIVGHVKVNVFHNRTGLAVPKNKLVEVPAPYSSIIKNANTRGEILD